VFGAGFTGPAAFSALEEEAGHAGRYDPVSDSFRADFRVYAVGTNPIPSSQLELCQNLLPLDRVLRRSLMRRTILALTIFCLGGSFAWSQEIGVPGVMYSGAIAGGTGCQLYPYDRQDPWLHGQFQRVPAYGGFSSFRPYNYRHVLSQTQIATSVWGSAHGHAYSQQFWNRYRGDYLNGNVHSQTATAVRPVPHSPDSPVSYQAATPVATAPTTDAADRPVHIYPAGVSVR
jgi:hypothetical protein